MTTAVTSIGLTTTTAALPSRDLTQLMNEAVTRFLKNEGNPLTSNFQHLEIDGVHFYGVHKDQQLQSSTAETRALYQQLKSHILQNMGLQPDTQVIQVVGDSAKYTEEGTERGKEFLFKDLSSNCLIEYGYTSHDSPTRRCVNAIVGNIIEENNLQHRAIGNLVNRHSKTALTEWGCTGIPLKHYMIVYNEEGTVFGDDTISSDFFGDTLRVLEGGIQSFQQIVHALMLDQKVEAISNLRTFETAQFEGKYYFSATEFLKQLLHDKPTDLQAWYDAYLDKHLIANPKRGDYATKKPLLDNAWKLFIENNLYEKLHLITFIGTPPSML